MSDQGFHALGRGKGKIAVELIRPQEGDIYKVARPNRAPLPNIGHKLGDGNNSSSRTSNLLPGASKASGTSSRSGLASDGAVRRVNDSSRSRALSGVSASGSQGSAGGIGLGVGGKVGRGT
eukprot:CAMPEP_0196585986 /NCGR_PEP_ID=MMETSP1081-20130531/52786_1 /TAXON_ID=36882 /ORGANISM="Pyramimonas amylifera, Strain CCMP720" /LENGTH=120 /DNA_ID=CAMNT_0041907717 /DNA_START=64 /DNA_END=423 /DNA_ORIENTATION=+